MSQIDLFLLDEGEELYKRLKKDNDGGNGINNSYAWHKNARERINDAFNRHAQHLDKKFITQFRQDLFSCLWELKLIEYLSHLKEGTVEEISTKGKVSIPDFKWSVGDDIYYIEATCADSGQVSSYPYLNEKLNLSSVPLVRDSSDGHQEYRERLIGSFRHKALCKYNPLACDENICKHKEKSGYKNAMGNSGYIIAISMAKINFYNQPFNWRVDLSCFFPCSSYATMLLTNTGQVQDIFHEYNPAFVKQTNPNASISVDIFSNENYSHVSAVLISYGWPVLFPDLSKDLSEYDPLLHFGPTDNDFILIHNPFAAVPLKERILPVQMEFQATHRDGKYTIQRVDHIDG